MTIKRAPPTSTHPYQSPASTDSVNNGGEVHFGGVVILVQPIGLANPAWAVAGVCTFLGFFRIESVSIHDTPCVGSGDGPGRCLVIVMRRTAMEVSNIIGEVDGLHVAGIHANLAKHFYDALLWDVFLKSDDWRLKQDSALDFKAMKRLYNDVAPLKHSFKQRVVGTGLALSQLAMELSPYLEYLQSSTYTHEWWQCVQRKSGSRMIQNPTSQRGNCEVFVFSLAFVIQKDVVDSGDINTLLDAFRNNAKQHLLFKYLQCQCKGIMLPEYDWSEGACLASRTEFGSRIDVDVRPDSCAFGVLCKVATELKISYKVQFVIHWSIDVNPKDSRSVAEATNFAEVLSAILQLTQGSFTSSRCNGQPGFGLHKLLFERQGKRVRHLFET